MEEKKLELAINRMVEDVNLYSRNVERAKIKNLPLIEREYFSRKQGIEDAMFHLGYRLEEDGKRADRKKLRYTRLPCHRNCVSRHRAAVDCRAAAPNLWQATALLWAH